MITRVPQPKATYILTRRTARIGTLHRNPTERCNTDDAKERDRIDVLTALALLRTEQAHACKHCWPDAP